MPRASGDCPVRNRRVTLVALPHLLRHGILSESRHSLIFVRGGGGGDEGLRGHAVDMLQK